MLSRSWREHMERTLRRRYGAEFATPELRCAQFWFRNDAIDGER